MPRRGFRDQCDELFPDGFDNALYPYDMPDIIHVTEADFNKMFE